MPPFTTHTIHRHCMVSGTPAMDCTHHHTNHATLAQDHCLTYICNVTKQHQKRLAAYHGNVDWQGAQDHRTPAEAAVTHSCSGWLPHTGATTPRRSLLDFAAPHTTTRAVMSTRKSVAITQTTMPLACAPASTSA
jgi:hypothetical protein